MLNDLLNDRRSSLGQRIQLKLATPEQVDLAEQLFARMKIWLLVTSDEDKDVILNKTRNVAFYSQMAVYSITDIKNQLDLISEETS